MVERGLVEGLSSAQGLIMAGKVYSGEKKLEKAGLQISEEAALEVRGQDHPWVSRGGLKLTHGFFVLTCNATTLEFGASTSALMPG